MRKRLQNLFVPALICLLCYGQAAAQQRQVSGKVSDETGTPLPGVNVIVKGSAASGTITDGNGAYTLSVNGDDAVLAFSFIGFATQEVTVGSQTTIDVTLLEGIATLDEVVVSSFGIEKEKKALGYSVTQIGGDKFTESRAINVGTALTGKIAGVNVTPPASGAAGSSRVVIRGGSSLRGNDQPLYVVNGMPIETGNLGNAGMWGGNDSGDGLAAINPDDIESISVLKGNAAAALYGARAANGVILITTKSGKARKGIGISFNSNLTVENVIDQTDFQKVYGPGLDGAAPTNALEARDVGGSHWGKPYDNSSVIQFDGESRPYTHLGEGVKDFYRTGKTLNNSLALSGGNETGTYRFGFSDLDNSDIMPNAGFKRRVANASINSKLKRLTFDLTAQYSNQRAKNRPRLSDSPGNANYAVITKPGNLPFDVIKGSPDKLGALENGNELQYQGSVYLTNPYWAAYQFFREDVTNRVLGKISLKYDITDWLYVMGRVGLDYQSRVDDRYEPYGTAYIPLGSYNLVTRSIQENNADVLIGVQKQLGDFSVDALVGGNRMRRSSKSLEGGGGNLVVPFFHSITNVAAPAVTFLFSEYGINSIFGSANVGFRNFLFLNLTARQDQFSTLSPGSSKLFYPSVGTSLVLSDLVQLPQVFTFAKVRASWGKTGGGAPDPYALALTYGLVGAGHLGASLGQINNTSIPFAGLKPYESNEFEIGADVRFFNNRLGFDVAYYNRKTTDDILDRSISALSGFPSTTINIGEMSNKGVELLVNAVPVSRNNFTWELSLNYTRNISEVLDLGVDAFGDPIEFINLDESRLQRDRIRHIVGEQLGMIAGYKQLRIDGKPVYDSDGFPVRSNAYETIARGRHPISAGLTNTLTYKSFRLNFLLDMRYGGSVMSATNAVAYSSGLHKETADARANGLTVTGVDAEGNDRTWQIPGNAGDPASYLIDNYYSRYTQITENFVYDASFLKLREFSLGYTFSSSMLSRTPFQSASISLVGRNLLLLWKKVDNIDPESAFTTAGTSQGLEYFGMPATRSMGVNISLTF